MEERLKNKENKENKSTTIDTNDIITARSLNNKNKSKTETNFYKNNSKKQPNMTINSTKKTSAPALSSSKPKSEPPAELINRLKSGEKVKVNEYFFKW